jgi:rfaE bifunctional protein nucleotidyltransferase chain/domain
LRSKIISLDQLARISAEMRDAGKKLVATNGCFDLLHVGHVRYLEAARTLGDALVVGVNGDASVRALKGDSRPLNREQDRAEVLAALSCVDAVAIFSEQRATHFLEVARPMIYAKGGDYTPASLDAEEQRVLAAIGCEIKIIPFESGYSTTQLIEQMNCA